MKTQTNASPSPSQPLQQSFAQRLVKLNGMLCCAKCLAVVGANVPHLCKEWRSR